MAKTTATRRSINSTFQRGSAVFTCNVCERKTRYTGVQSFGNQICPPCYELAGIENEISDGHCLIETRREEILRLVADVAAKGGNVTEWDGLVSKAKGAS
jgi:hypothetical protein